MSDTTPSEWNGEFSIDDCDIQNFTPDLPDEIRPSFVNAGVRLIHRPTGKEVVVYSSPDESINRTRAERALKNSLGVR